jgi:hypothetical protein
LLLLRQQQLLLSLLLAQLLLLLHQLLLLLHQLLLLLQKLLLLLHQLLLQLMLQPQVRRGIGSAETAPGRFECKHVASGQPRPAKTVQS